MSDEPMIKTPSKFGNDGNLLLERELGQGGMGGVYLGRDTMLDRPVAVKVMLPEYGKDEEFVSKFKKEAQAVAKLLHPNIAQVYTYGIFNEMPYIAMELVTGTSLDKMIENNKGTTEVQRVIKIIQQVAQALQCANDRGIIHGDVKPENILLDADGNAKLVDFGLAAMQKDTSEIWGTPYYISPEKVKKEPVDFRADMYSLGGTLYHALTGVAPYEGDDMIAVVKARFNGMPKKPSDVRPSLTPQVDELIMTMLAFNKEDRYPSWEALIEAIKEVLKSGLSMTQKNHTTKVDAAAPAAGKPATATTGTKKLMTKRPMKTLKKGTLIKKNATTGKVEGDGAADGEVPPENPDAPKPEGAEGEDEDNEKSPLVKILMFVGIGIVAILAIVGFLVWVKAKEKADEEAAYQAKIEKACTDVRAAVAANRESVNKYNEEFVEFAKRAQTNFEAVKADLEKTAPGVEVPEVTELGDTVKACDEAAKTIAEKLTAILAMCDEAEQISGVSKEAAEALSQKNREIVDNLEAVKASKEVETVKKNIGLIKSKGERVIKNTVARLKKEAFEAEQKAKKEQEEAEKKAREEKRQAEYAARVEQETKDIADKFESLCTSGVFLQLDWKSAARQMRQISDEFKTPEGETAAKEQMRKVTAMESVQAIFIKNLKGYKFVRNRKGGSIKGAEVIAVNDSDLQLKRPDGTIQKLTWRKFYKEYHGNLNELIIQFIEKGRENCKPKLNVRQWADAMCGAALTMRIICSDDAAAAERGTALIKEAAKGFNDEGYRAQLTKMFPDVDLSKIDDEE